MTEVFVSRVIGAPIERTWPVLRDFAALPDWVPAVRECRIEGGEAADRVGCVRAFHLHDGGFLRERLLALSDVECSLSYAILESPMPLEDYVATIRAHPITDGDRSFVEWSARFECAPREEAALVERIGNGVFRAGLERLERRVAGGARADGR